MKIGLVRHFKVNLAFPKKILYSKSDLSNWFDAYGIAQVEEKVVDLGGVEWNSCFSSPLYRAIHTAKHIYAGEIIQIEALKELDLLPLLSDKIKMPFIAWGILVRIKFSSENEITAAFRKNISAFVDELLSKKDQNILVVSHGFAMMFLKKELLKRGFKGDKFNLPQNGKLYLYHS